MPRRRSFRGEKNDDLPLGLHELPEFFSEAGLQQLIQASRRNNAQVAVTGFLLFDGDIFAQALEGSRSTVTHTYNRICSDPRHANLHLISCVDAQERLFPEWSMGLLDRISPEARDKFLTHFTIERVHPNKISSDRLLFFLQTLATDMPAEGKG